MLVIVAPGQGAQTPGFLVPWLEDPTFASRFDWLSTVAGLDLAHYGTEADADTIRQTEIAQPLLVATGLIAALAVFPHPADVFQLSVDSRPRRSVWFTESGASGEPGGVDPGAPVGE